MVKKVFLLLGVFFLLIAIPVTFFVVKQRQELRQKAAPATTMSISPSQKSIKVGDTLSVDVNIDTGENSIVAASVYLTFDPTKLQAQSIVNSSQFPNILAPGDTSQTGKVSIAVGTASYSQPFKGIGAVATVKFLALQSSVETVSIRFGPESFAGSIGEGSTNALIGTTPSQITITTAGSEAPTMTPTPSTTDTTPTVTMTPTSTPILTITPTGTATQLTLTSHANGSSTTQTLPTLSGKAPSGSSVTITFYPGSTTGAVTADSSGNWTFTPSGTIGVGTYTITIASTNTTTGATQTITSTLIIVNPTPTTSTTITSTPSPTSASSPSAIPVTGFAELTYLLSGIALTCIVAGAILLFSYF